MAAPNILDPNNELYGKTVAQAVTTSATAILTNTLSSGKVLRVSSLIVSNVDGTNAADITVDFYRDSTAYLLASTISIPADASLVVLSKDNSIYLEEGDSLRCTASANLDLQAICSYEEIG